MGKYILIDLDGTLTDTAHEKFKPFKDGEIDTIIEDIPVIAGAKNFIQELKTVGHIPVIISDGHPKYVNLIAQKIFDVPALSLSDKPNSLKTKEFLKLKFGSLNYSDQCVIIGDTWLDIELGRSLNCPTIMTTFYKSTSVEERDGIGQEWRHYKSGPTYVTESFDRIHEMLADPLKYLLSVEAIFHNIKSDQGRKFFSDTANNQVTAFRSLGRQNAGECDCFGVAAKYFLFQRPDRPETVVRTLANAIENYLEHVIKSAPQFKWDILTYVSDKGTTVPANKMKQLWEFTNVSIERKPLLVWKENIQGNIKSQKHYKERKCFVKENMYVSSEFDLNGKSVIVIDDQFTTGGTAFAIRDMLRDKGVKHILFVTMFYLITNVSSEQLCPRCNKRLVIKIRRSDGNKFHSCVAPTYGGEGCGYVANIIQ
jgi:predicted HAD superfamily phosphohydrolase YqeG